MTSLPLMMKFWEKKKRGYIYLYKHVGWIGGKGIGIQGLSSNALGNLVFPLPPVEEQKRIVAKIEELMPLVEMLKEKAL